MALSFLGLDSPLYRVSDLKNVRVSCLLQVVLMSDTLRGAGGLYKYKKGKADMSKHTQEDLEKHLSRVERCGKDFVVIEQQYQNRKYLVPIRCTCGSRFCESCQWKKRNELLRKLKTLRQWRHIIALTFTFPADGPDPLEHPSWYSKKWNLFMTKLRQELGHFKFFRVVELTKQGIPHYHVLVNRFIPKYRITEIMKSIGLGGINYIQLVDQQHIFRYVTKYVTKGTQAENSTAYFFYMTRMRQFSYSPHLFLVLDKKKNYHFFGFYRCEDVSDLVFQIDLDTKYKGIPYYTRGSPSPPIFFMPLDTEEREDLKFAEAWLPTRKDLYFARHPDAAKN